MTKYEPEIDMGAVVFWIIIAMITIMIAALIIFC